MTSDFNSVSFERWIDVRNHPEYEVSDSGRVRNKNTGRIVKPQLNRPGGYSRVNVGGRYEYVSKLVLEGFYNMDASNYRITHYNGDKNDDSLGNLVWTKR